MKPMDRVQLFGMKIKRIRGHVRGKGSILLCFLMIGLGILEGLLLDRLDVDRWVR